MRSLFLPAFDKVLPGVPYPPSSFLGRPTGLRSGLSSARASARTFATALPSEHLTPPRTPIFALAPSRTTTGLLRARYRRSWGLWWCF
jgi:hypothetical protein